MTASNYQGYDPFNPMAVNDGHITSRYEGVVYYSAFGAHCYHYDLIDPRRVLIYQRMNSRGQWSAPIQAGTDDFGNLYAY